MCVSVCELVACVCSEMFVESFKYFAVLKAEIIGKRPFFCTPLINSTVFYSKQSNLRIQTAQATTILKHFAELRANHVWTRKGKDCRQEVCQQVHQGRTAGVQCLLYFILSSLHAEGKMSLSRKCLRPSKTTRSTPPLNAKECIYQSSSLALSLRGLQLLE